MAQTSAQRRASRRNIARARKVQAQRRQRKATNRWLLPRLTLLVIALVLIIATKGQILWVALLGVVAYVTWRVVRRKRARAWQEQAAMQAYEQDEYERQQIQQQLDYEHWQRLHMATHLGPLLALSPTEFEQTVGAVLVAHGYSEVRHVGGAGDQGADLLCTDPEGLRVVVQCKRYGTQKVTGPHVVHFIGARYVHRAHRAMLVTTSSLTRDALRTAEENSIEVIDGVRLVELATMAADRTPTVEAAG